MSNEEVTRGSGDAEQSAEAETPAAAPTRARRKTSEADAGTSSEKRSTARRSSTATKATETAAAEVTSDQPAAGREPGDTTRAATPSAEPVKRPATRRSMATKKAPTATTEPGEQPESPTAATGGAGMTSAVAGSATPATEEPSEPAEPRKRQTARRSTRASGAAARSEEPGPVAPRVEQEEERATTPPATPPQPAPVAEDQERFESDKAADLPSTTAPKQRRAARGVSTVAEPAAADESQQTAALPDIPPSTRGERMEYRGSGRRVVVAEDEALIRLDVVETLTEAGFDVVGEAGDGERAVALATELRPDVVVMDIKMPVLDGISAAERIGKSRIAPVVLLTAFSQAELVERARDAGAMAYVVKPFTPAELLPAIEIAVARHQEIVALETEVADLAERFETRKRVERAKGLLMTKMGLTEPESFRWIQKTSMDRRLTMREVADAVIEQVGSSDKPR